LILVVDFQVTTHQPGSTGASPELLQIFATGSNYFRMLREGQVVIGRKINQLIFRAEYLYPAAPDPVQGRKLPQIPSRPSLIEKFNHLFHYCTWQNIL
jgi:hypothetical protein